MRAAIGRPRTAIILIILSLVTASGFSQQGSTQDTSKPPEQRKPAEQTTPQGQQTPEQTNPPEEQTPSVAAQAANAALEPVRLFNLLEKKSIMFPDIASSTTALTPTEKFKLFVDNSVSVHSELAGLSGSAIGQAGDSPTGFEQGWGAYGKRFGTSMARESSGEFFGTFILASALHEDPRFFPRYNLTFKSSIKYSFRCLFITRNDDGREVKNISGLAGPLMGEALANVYWPDRNRTVGDTLFRYGLDLVEHAAGNMFREYWPVISAKVQQKQRQQGDARVK